MSFTATTRAPPDIYVQAGFFRETFIFNSIVVYTHEEEVTNRTAKI